MKIPKRVRKFDVKDLVRTCDSCSAISTVDDNIDNVMWSKSNFNDEEKIKNWKIFKNYISVAYFDLKNYNLRKKNENKQSIPIKSAAYFLEREWFIKKFEMEVGKNVSAEMVSFDTLEKDMRHRKRWKQDGYLLYEYKEPPRPDEIPDIVWNGPPLKCCFCISPMEDCECQGDIVLPPRMLPLGIYWKIMLRLLSLQQKYLMKINYFKELKLTLPQLPEKPFVKRLQEHLEAEEVVQNQLQEMEIQRGPEFCIRRCYHYYKPTARKSNSYFQLKKELLLAYMNSIVPKVVVKTAPPPEPKPKPTIADEIIDGLYRSVSTQATTDENGEFVMGDVTHILFGNSSVYQDIEGTPYCVCTYEEVAPKIPQPMVKKLENLLSISRIKKKVSMLTSSLMSSIVEIEDTGIPITTRATQDPPLDSYFESIKVPSKLKIVKITKEEVCPCCKKYKELQTVENDRFESNDIAKYDDFISKGVESLFKSPFERLQLGTSDNNNQNIVGKQFLHKKDNSLSETKNDVENESKLKNINDNIELLKRDLMADTQVKKYKSVDINKDLYQIQSESRLNLEVNKTEQKTKKREPGVVLRDISKKNDHMNSLEFLESIKPCCIDNLRKQLEIKISDEQFLKKLLEDQVFRRIYRCIYKIEEKRQKELENIGTEMDNTRIEIDSIDAPEDKSKQIKSLKSSINIKMKKITDFIKKQKSSFKVLIKKMEEANIKSKNKNALSFQDFKQKMKISFNKMNNAVSSFCKRNYTKSSNNIKQLMSSLKKRNDKVNSLDDSENTANDHLSKDTITNPADLQDSKTSEKEVFSVQYNSTCDFYSKSNN